ncbi:helix-turn-helix transcriptional regulator [Alkalilimnicola ehrlichii]|uniref:Phage transcriptional regulator, AlpA n=1 Tax=Alkalilimnicola ehrlichii (strain ATCC BAA-1101 / DSM 17681 / MLHE-1) TaxID=187272 RepID=Q0AAZ5_ALKEH|nr:AlpA family phage regulatory protein [Alkalilimnicola ehrlichii]ABI55992.1 phage transcriptional regulator, AlpA [Alkalilimnicola ehrlichii MLHE-1]
MTATAQQTTYLSLRQITERYNVHKSTAWRWVAAGRFPKPVKLSPGCTRWKLSDLEQWEAEQAGEGA